MGRKYTAKPPPGRHRDVKVGARRTGQACSIFLAEGTPHHKFVLDETASKFDELLVIYLAAMAKHAIESPTPPTNSVDFKVKCVQTLLDYCHRFDVKLKGTLKKMKEANTEGKLKEYFTQ